MARPRTRKRERIDRERNRALVDRLVRERPGRLRSIARRYGVREELVDDVVQSALLAVLRFFPGPDDDDFAYRYAARCVQSEAIKAHRRHARKESHQVAMPSQGLNDRANDRRDVGLPDLEAADPAERVTAREAEREAKALLLALPPEERAVLVLGAAGFTHAEIAARLGLSERAVRKRVERANRRLRERPRDR